MMQINLLKQIKLILLTFVLITLNACAENSSRLVVQGNEQSSVAPHGKGNVYAPDIVRYQEKYYLFYGAQGRDGHDRIKLATSKDARTWKKQGVVFFVKGANHVNDPSVLIVKNKFYMYYTLAMRGVTDSIGLAISKDGVHWENKGVVLKPAKASAWDSLLVGRPSVLYEKGKFRMWYDGRADLPTGSPDKTAPQSDKSHRHVGYAESKDGKRWEKRSTYVFSRDAGGVHVSRINNKYIMLIESHAGTFWAQSANGIQWDNKGVLIKSDPESSPYGHVTPFIFQNGDRFELYYGAARANTWDNNFIMMKTIPGGRL